MLPKLLTFAVLALTARVLAETAPAPAPKPLREVADIGIGGGETSPLTHLRFKGVPRDAKVVKVSAHLIVDKVGPKGLNFFAIQVNFPNQTWAHGGPQCNSGKEFANWGGLVNRGGGSKDYKEVDWKKDLLLIECGVGKPNTVPWAWERGAEYVLTVERGDKVVLPAGLNKPRKVEVPERTMWEWRFTIVPVKPGATPFTSLIYDSSDHISRFYLWNESGYGSKNEEQHARWSLPVYRTEGSDEDRQVESSVRF